MHLTNSMTTVELHPSEQAEWPPVKICQTAIINRTRTFCTLQTRRSASLNCKLRSQALVKSSMHECCN